MLETLKEQWQHLQKEQKISVCLLGVCGVLVVGLSFYRLQANVIEPFLVDNNSIAASKMIIGQTPADLEALQKRTDTDGDGLSDWDEANIYHTNPNLRDSCGDGVLDNIRVVTGKNISCPTKTVGIEARPVTDGDAAATGTGLSPVQEMQTLYPQLPVGQMYNPALEDGTSQVSDLSSLSIGATPDAPLPRDPETIRAALKGRVDDITLNKISDQDLLKLYDQAINIQDGASQGASLTP